MNVEDMIADAIASKVVVQVAAKLDELLARRSDLDDEWVSVADAARLTKKKPSTIRLWVRKGWLSPRGRGRGMRLSKREVLELRPEQMDQKKKSEAPQDIAAGILAKVRRAS